MKKERFRTTFSKMTISFVAFGLVPLLLMSLFFFYRYSGMIRDDMTASYDNMTGYVARRVGGVLDSVDNAMGVIYDYQYNGSDTFTDVLTDDSLNATDRGLEIQELLRYILSQSDYISSIRMVDTKGEIFSLYYSQNKTLRNDAADHTAMDIFGEGDSLTDLKMLGTLPEDTICLNSDDYVFTLVRNYMDVSTVGTACSSPLATLFADINVDVIRDIIADSGLSQGQIYVYSTGDAHYLYSESADDYLNASHPLEFCDYLLDGSSGYEQVGSQWVFYENIAGTDTYAVLVMDNDDIMGTFFRSCMALIVILCFAAAFLLIIYLAFSIRMSEPTRRLKEAMEQVEGGNLDVRVDLKTGDEMEYVAEGFNNMAESLEDYINQVYVAEICKKDAELNALKMQIRPHYLYNSLDVIRMTALDQGDGKTATLLESLAKQLRYVMGTQSDRVYLRDEMNAIREYFVLMRTRYEDRISLMIYMSDEDGVLAIPRLLLQPAVENAVRHGLAEKEGRGSVAIRVERKEDYLEIVVMDDGVGIPGEELQAFVESLENHEIGVIDPVGPDGMADGVGMKNVYDRIKLNCGMEYGFTMQSKLGMGTIVTYKLPIWEEL
ncbi:MAG: sensor histidine kinase [Clostridiales bacterium]|nr:sensor histidine kinase [Clostridiales bacterium]